MAGQSRPELRNLLVGDLGDDSELQRRGFQRVPLSLGDTLVHAGDVPTYAYFPERGVISMLSSTHQGQTVEVAAIGREGVAAGLVTAVAVPSPVDLVVQVDGSALQLNALRLLEHIDQSAAFRQRWLEFLQSLITQIAQSAVCNRYHPVPRRFARWVLTVADRAESDVIPMKHEFAAAMIGGDRPRVSSALRGLREHHVVECQRGRLRILDRQALMGLACECYVPAAAPALPGKARARAPLPTTDPLAGTS